MKKFYSNKCFKVNNCEYISEYIVENHDNKYFVLKGYNNIKNGYIQLKDSFNYNTFINALKMHNIKKLFSEKEFLI
jgi:hypothetical protein